MAARACLQAMMRLHDTDGNGNIDFDEFAKLHIWWGGRVWPGRWAEIETPQCAPTRALTPAPPPPPPSQAVQHIQLLPTLRHRSDRCACLPCAPCALCQPHSGTAGKHAARCPGHLARQATLASGDRHSGAALLAIVLQRGQERINRPYQSVASPVAICPAGSLDKAEAAKAVAHAGYRLEGPAFDALFKSFDPDR